MNSTTGFNSTTRNYRFETQNFKALYSFANFIYTLSNDALLFIDFWLISSPNHRKIGSHLNRPVSLSITKHWFSEIFEYPCELKCPILLLFLRCEQKNMIYSLLKYPLNSLFLNILLIQSWKYRIHTYNLENTVSVNKSIFGKHHYKSTIMPENHWNFIVFGEL